MRILKIILVVLVVIGFTACNQTFSDKEKELLGETMQEVIEDAVTEPAKPAVKQSKAQYNIPMCDLLTHQDIEQVFSGVMNFTQKKVKQKRPECEIAFFYGKKKNYMQPRAGIIIGGFLPRKGQTSRSYLENMMVSQKEYRKIEGLGDEAYIFPDQMMVSVIMIKDDLSYFLQLNQSEKTSEQKTIQLMTIIESKL